MQVLNYSVHWSVAIVFSFLFVRKQYVEKTFIWNLLCAISFQIVPNIPYATCLPTGMGHVHIMKYAPVQYIIHSPVSVSTFVPSETLTKFILVYPEWPPGSAHFPCFNSANQTRSFKMALFLALVLFTLGSRWFISACEDVDSTKQWPKEIPKYWQETCPNYTVTDKSIICSVGLSLRSLEAKTRRNLQSTVPCAAALRETICFLPFRQRSVTVFGGGKGCFRLWQLHMQAS